MAYPFVAVHAGAGYHSQATGTKLKKLCKMACTQAMKLLTEGKSCREATALAISILEESPLTNAGVGSNLSLIGSVECDASIMDGTGAFGAVGALQGMDKPINVALRLLEESAQGPLLLGRIPPLLLVGEGAKVWAKEHSISTCCQDDLITDHSRAVYLDNKTRLDEAAKPLTKRRRVQLPNHKPALDTVGAVVIDNLGEAAAGVSSGGISLKYPGRVGQAAIFGSGCWAENDPGPETRAVATCTSGTGEYIIKTMLAKESADAVVETGLHIALDDHFLRSKSLAAVDQKLAGVIALNLTKDGALHFSWGHTTESMCIGYMSAVHNEPKAMISRHDCMEKVGKTAKIQAICFTT